MTVLPSYTYIPLVAIIRGLWRILYITVNKLYYQTYVLLRNTIFNDVRSNETVTSYNVYVDNYLFTGYILPFL